MGISEQFGTWKIGVIKNLSEYCGFFLCDFLDPKCLDTLNSYTTYFILILKEICLVCYIWRSIFDNWLEIKINILWNSVSMAVYDTYYLTELLLKLLHFMELSTLYIYVYKIYNIYCIIYMYIHCYYWDTIRL